MSKARRNEHIARLIVGAMSIDGMLNKEERKKVAASLEEKGMPELIAYVGAALDEDFGDFNMFQECKDLMESLGTDASGLAPLIFRIITDVIASDRFVSAQEASYLSAMARRFNLSAEDAGNILKQLLADRHGRLEITGSSVDELIHPHLKALLSFEGSEDLVGEIGADSLEEMLYQAKESLSESSDITLEEVERALSVLGLHRGATLEEAQEFWKETIDTLNLPKMANLGETFVTAALSRITKIHDAYKTVLHFHEHHATIQKAQSDSKRLEKEIKRAHAPSTGEDLTENIEQKLTGVGVVKPDENDFEQK